MRYGREVLFLYESYDGTSALMEMISKNKRRHVSRSCQRSRKIGLHFMPQLFFSLPQRPLASARVACFLRALSPPRRAAFRVDDLSARLALGAISMGQTIILPPLSTKCAERRVMASKTALVSEHFLAIFPTTQKKSPAYNPFLTPPPNWP